MPHTRQSGAPPPQFAIEAARHYDKCALEVGADRTGCLVDKALVNVGALFLENVQGRVSTEVDPKLAYDTGEPLSERQAGRQRRHAGSQWPPVCGRQLW